MSFLFLLELVLWIFNVFSFSVIDAGTFISVSVALLAIIVTIAIGWQVFNIIEFKKKQEDLESQQKKAQDKIQETQKELTRQQEEIKEDFKTGITFVWRMALIPNLLAGGKPMSVVKLCLSSLDDLLEMNDIHGFINSINTVLAIAENNVKNCSEYDVSKVWKEMSKIDKRIRNNKNYSLIADKYNPIYQSIKSKVKIQF